MICLALKMMQSIISTNIQIQLHLFEMKDFICSLFINNSVMDGIVLIHSLFKEQIHFIHEIMNLNI